MNKEIVQQLPHLPV